MANAQCVRTREVVKVLNMLINDLAEYPLLGPADSDPWLVVAFDVALNGDNAELNVDERKIYERLVRSAEARAGRELVFRAPLPAHAIANKKR